MLVTSPRSVRFGNLSLADARLVAIDRAPVERVEEFDQAGPFCVLADVTRRRTTIRVEREPPDAAWPAEPLLQLGAQAELVVHASPAAADAALVRLSATCVLVAVDHRLDARPALQTLTFIAVSPAGDSDPLSVTHNTRLEAP
ncbi:MAG: hypothetical protein KF768_03715 [Phycisphaeraceae bacterium]|nr:hypothetical protein [Phycisphaeraceae bacterium]